MIGKPGATVFQMNGQPTAQNTRETGANGAMPVQLNWQNDQHDQRLAAHWNIEPQQLPHWAPPTHVMQMLRFCETGSMEFLWVSATNPAVSLPELHRVRSVLGQERLFLVVQDAFLTETAQLADVVLPSAMWGEKTGTFTNADRTVHLAEKAVDPPDGARTDFEIFCDYARRMGFIDRDGGPLVKFSSPEEAFDDFKELSQGRPSDYSGLSYDLLRASGGIQWPCNDDHPTGQERLYQDGRFWTEADRCQSYGHDLETGATNEAEEYRAQDPAGRAVIKAAHYTEPHETPGDRYPFIYTTGRTVFHWHTRTKTGRASQLQAAAPEMWVELCPTDADELGIGEGDWVGVESARGQIRARARVSGVRPGVVFAPFHYGYWDREDQNSEDRAANELSITAWDPVSKQPLFKTAAVAVRRLGDTGGSVSAAPTIGAAAPVTDIGTQPTAVRVRKATTSDEG
jgi:anaerobic selenocysteine-containing dehydrogenase